MNNIFRTLVLFALVATSVQLFGQDTNEASHSLTVNIAEVALLDIEGGTSVALNPTAPTEAGNPIDFSTATNSALWLNYSSIIGNAPENSRAVTVSVAGTMPTGALLKVQAAAVAGSGAGTRGSSAGLVTIAATATDYTVITGIGSCYTGNGTNNGHNVTYSLTEDAANYGSFNFDTDYTLTITYTLSDN